MSPLNSLLQPHNTNMHNLPFLINLEHHFVHMYQNLSTKHNLEHQHQQLWPHHSQLSNKHSLLQSQNLCMLNLPQQSHLGHLPLNLQIFMSLLTNLQPNHQTMRLKANQHRSLRPTKTHLESFHSFLLTMPSNHSSLELHRQTMPILSSVTSRLWLFQNQMRWKNMCWRLHLEQNYT